jgi:DNA-binding PadR family transcriptional regulator
MITPHRFDALRLVADGKLWFSMSMGTWEPDEGHRLPAFDWLEEQGLIEADVDAEPVGRVTKRVPVRVTTAGEALLRA